MEKTGLCWIISCDIVILLLALGCEALVFVGNIIESNELQTVQIIVSIGVSFILISIIPNMIMRYSDTNIPNNLFRCVAADLIFIGFSLTKIREDNNKRLFKLCRLIGIMVLIVALLVRILISFCTRKRKSDPESLAQSFNIEGMYPPEQN
jgi:hypothetical protein